MAPNIFKFVIIQLFFLKISVSQVLLTNRMVYDYNVGDTIQYKVPDSGCMAVELKCEMVILSKQINPNDIVYTYFLKYEDTHQIFLYSPQDPRFSGASTYTLQVQNLDSIAKYTETESKIFCVPLQTYTDTMFLDYGGKTVNQRKYNNYSSSSCGLYGSNGYLIEGLGEFYRIYSVTTGDGCLKGKQLVYYHKIGETPWGTHLPLFTFDVGIKEQLLENQLQVFPTIVEDDFLNIEYSGEGLVEVTAVSMLGKVEQKYELSENKTKMHLNLNPGFYLFKFKKVGADEVTCKKVIVN